MTTDGHSKHDQSPYLHLHVCLHVLFCSQRLRQAGRQTNLPTYQPTYLHVVVVRTTTTISTPRKNWCCKTRTQSFVLLSFAQLGSFVRSLVRSLARCSLLYRRRRRPACMHSCMHTCIHDYNACFCLLVSSFTPCTVLYPLHTYTPHTYIHTNQSISISQPPQSHTTNHLASIFQPACLPAYPHTHSPGASSASRPSTHVSALCCRRRPQPQSPSHSHTTPRRDDTQWWW
ncbi:uncharacterized protein J3D65DRAFT_194048 [Phyllosticta citribraziliensis]|uniref:Uncharacterized protein n=1 Tax=Phyllosticta citribraziliensis TaxID=989973 RepID=A0ABR1M2Z8_9PEZI